MPDINDLLHSIQLQLKAPKDKKNTFGGYSYRSCESILEAVKPIIGHTLGATLVLSDEVVQIGERYYVKATATLRCNNPGGTAQEVCAIAYAREPENKKGMDDSQLTGSTSSYARKYALNGLFAIDDAKDADTDEFHRATTEYVPDYFCEVCGKGMTKKWADQSMKKYGHRFCSAECKERFEKEEGKTDAE